MRVILRPGVRFQMKGVAYEIVKFLPEQVLLVLNLGLESERQMSMEEIWEAWGKHELRFEVKGSRTQRRNPGDHFNTEFEDKDFDMLPEKQRELAKRRLTWILPLIKMQPEERTREFMKSHADECFEDELSEDDLSEAAKDDLRQARAEGKRLPLEYSISPRSLQRHLSVFVKSNYNIRALTHDYGKSGGKGKFRIDPFAEREIQLSIRSDYLKRKRPRVRTAYREMQKRIIDDNQNS